MARVPASTRSGRPRSQFCTRCRWEPGRLSGGFTTASRRGCPRDKRGRGVNRRRAGSRYYSLLCLLLNRRLIALRPPAASGTLLEISTGDPAYGRVQARRLRRCDHRACLPVSSPATGGSSSRPGLPAALAPMESGRRTAAVPHPAYAALRAVPSGVRDRMGRLVRTTATSRVVSVSRSASRR